MVISVRILYRDVILYSIKDVESRVRKKLNYY